MERNTLLCVVLNFKTKNHPAAAKRPMSLNGLVTFTCPGNKNIDISIFNSSGEKVKTIGGGYFNCGVFRFEWDGTDSYCRKLPQGVFELRCCSGDTIQSRKILRFDQHISQQ